MVSLLFLLNGFSFCLYTKEKFVLLAIKTNIIDHSGILANNWSAISNASICTWIGVSCDLNNQSVIALNLSSMGLAGTVTPAIGNLSSLTLLDISYNNFSCFVPEELSHLHHLQQLLLSNNSFTGTIPASLGNLTKLEILDLSFNQLTGSVPAAIFNISSLRAIHLTANNLYGSLPVDICSHYVPKLERILLSLNRFEGKFPLNLFKCRELQYLSLSANEFSGSIPIEIGNLTMLKKLFLGYNNLEGEIPVEIGNLKLLELLSIPSSSLTGPIPNVIFNMSSLKMISLEENKLTGSFPMDMNYNLPVLEKLYLYTNQLKGQIPSCLWDCKGLQIISLYKNKFTGSIPKKVGNLTLLKALDLTDNNFTGSIPKKVGNLTLLKALYLAFNNFTGTLPSEFGKLNLESLLLRQNSLTGLIPFEIFNISTIIRISFSYNHLSGHLPSSLGLWTPNLECLYLYDNRLSGSIPSSISNASKLTTIEMSSNSFTGFIPSTIGNLRDLRNLFVGENNLKMEDCTPELRFFDSLSNCKNLIHLSMPLNQFNGILPASIANLSTSLRSFEAFGSKIKGEIPMGIGNLSHLLTLSLYSNELTGFIPSSLGRLKNLEQLYLEHNDLKGSIPNDLCRLERLGDLYLSDNKLEGPIPSCLGELSSMISLSLGSNNLTSTIPSTLWSLKDLLHLNLSTNSLIGSLPSYIGNLKVITEMDLSLNRFSGRIPSTIGKGQMLTLLSFAHNELQGFIPQSFGNLINLELLDLSNNNLSGTIPKSLEALRYLQYFNVSFNRLEGEIPIGGHFANFTAQSFIQNDGLCGLPRLQVHPCKRSWSNNLSPLKYILPPIIATTLLVAFIIGFIKGRKRDAELQIQLCSLPHAWRRVSYIELLQATNGFNESNLLGAGGIGSVYKAALSDEVNVAVKVFNLELEEAFKSFDVECEVLRNIRHRNLTKIISNCSNPDFLALVLEYMPNGSLEKWLYSYNYCLTILERLNIMIDIASALEYLHHGQTTPILHCDMKPSNVLLDKDMTAHVCDFGIAKLLGEDEFMAQTKTLATIGYMAPEYIREGIVSTKVDVYSYGILLMETFTRKKPIDEMFSDNLTMRNWVYEASLSSIVHVVDANLIGQEDEDFLPKKECASSVLHLALDCSTSIPTQRISMEDVVACAALKMKQSMKIGLHPPCHTAGVYRDAESQFLCGAAACYLLLNLFCLFGNCGFAGVRALAFDAGYLGGDSFCFQGEIPVEIGNLKLLEILDIRESSLTGPILNVIFNMSSLMAIILIKNNLTGSIPKKVGNLTLLNDLYLFDNMFTGPKQQIPKALRLLSISPLSGEWLRDLVLQSCGKARYKEWALLCGQPQPQAESPTSFSRARFRNFHPWAAIGGPSSSHAGATYARSIISSPYV
ncbi:hypothetical protein LguiA_004739 [Lonicera macranthoides]